MIRRVREVLRLQAQSITTPINLPFLARKRPIQEVAGIKLHARLIGQHLKDTSARGIVNFRSRRETFRKIPNRSENVLAVEHPVVIVTVALFYLLVIVVDSRAHGSGFAKIERRSFNGG